MRSTCKLLLRITWFYGLTPTSAPDWCSITIVLQFANQVFAW